MKTKHLISLLLLTLFLPFMTMQAQEKMMKSYWIHEDQVKPSMVAEYEAVCKELIAHCKTANLQGSDWITLAGSDFSYSFVGPIENMADLDKDPFASLNDKVGKEAMGKLWTKMNKCYDDHTDYVLNLDESLSYQPGGINQMPEGQNYRKNTIYYVEPGNYEKANEVAKMYKSLFEKKGSKMYYRVYRSGFGSDGTYFMVAVAAESPAAYETMMSENQQLLGEEGMKLNEKLMKIISKMETRDGWMRSDLSYVAK